MALETFTYISSLNASNPDGGDNLADGDAHLRGLKTVLLASFPEIAGVVSASHGELNWCVGVTSAIQTQLDAKAPIANASLTGTTTAQALSVSGALSVSATAVFTTRVVGITEAAGTNSTQFATTEFVQTAVASATGGVSRGRSYFYSSF